MNKISMLINKLYFLEFISFHIQISETVSVPQTIPFHSLDIVCFQMWS